MAFWWLRQWVWGMTRNRRVTISHTLQLYTSRQGTCFLVCPWCFTVDSWLLCDKSCHRWLNVNTWSCWFIRRTVFVTVGRNAPLLDASISRYTCIHIQLIVFIPIHPLHTFWDRCFMGSGRQHVVGFCGKRMKVGNLLMSNEVFVTSGLHKISANPLHFLLQTKRVAGNEHV